MMSPVIGVTGLISQVWGLIHVVVEYSTLMSKQGDMILKAFTDNDGFLNDSRRRLV
jgi:hypothetical protein